MAMTAGEHILIRRVARMMATDVDVQLAVDPAQRDEAERTADACMAWMGEVASALTRFDAQSELSRLNAAGGTWFAASELLYACVERALAAARATDGLFDPALLPQMLAWGYDRDFAEIAHREIATDGGVASAADRGSAPELHGGLAAAGGAWRGIELDAEERRIRLPKGVRLDLGGIAKGWAADVALDLHCANVESALINVGGDLRLRGGPRVGGGWSVGIRDPRGENEVIGLYPDLAAITFSRGGLATSGAVRRWWLRAGTRVHHLLDPRTGAPAHVWTGESGATDAEGYPLIATVTALARTAARAEVAAKVALLRGYPACLRAVESAWEAPGPAGSAESMDAGVALVLVLASGELLTSRNIGAWLATWGTLGAPLYLNATSGGATL